MTEKGEEEARLIKNRNERTGNTSANRTKRVARIIEQESTHVLPGSHFSKKSQTMRCRISSECAGTEKEKDKNNDLSTSE